MKNQNIHFYAIFLLLSLSLIPLKYANSQTECGVKGGPLFTNWRNDFESSSINIETKIGLSAGVFYRINNLIGPLNLQAEFLYQLKGAKTYILYNPYSYGYGYGYGDGYGYNSYGGYGGYGGYVYNYNSEENDSYSSGPWLTGGENFHYFNIPVFASVTLVKVIDVYAGPEIGYKFISSGNNSYVIAEKNFSAGISAGVAVHLGQNTKLDLRYSTDFTNLTDVTSTNLKNQGFGFIVQQTLFRKQENSRLKSID